MLQSVEIRNLSCIKELQLKLDFAEGKAPNGYRDHPLLSFIQMGNSAYSRMCPVLAIYGPNASGKTTILRAVRVLHDVVKHGWHPAAYEPNRISATQEDITYIALRFWKGEEQYFYSLGISADGIANERLDCCGVTVFSVENSKLKVLKETFEPQMADILSQFETRCVNLLTGKQVNAFVQVFAEVLPGLSREVLSAREFLISDLLFVDRNVDYYNGIEMLALTYEGAPEERRQAALALISKYLQKLDVRILGLNLIKKSAGDENDLHWRRRSWTTSRYSSEDYHLKTLHKAESGQYIWFDLQSESEGTQQLIGMLGALLTAVRLGKTVLIDELDDSLHSLLLQELVKLFKEKRINETAAQIVFTLHNTDLLAANFLGVSEVAIVNQVGYFGTRVMRLVDLPGIRNGSDFRRRYLRGDFGGIPFPCV